jgi:phosphoribosylglycinamide formyltransferase-1
MALVSGGGTNFQALLEAEKTGRLGPGRLAVAVSDRPGAYALERARLWGIPVHVEEPDPRLSVEKRRPELSDRIFRIARDYNIGLIVLAGFLSILQGRIIRHYAGRIINLHPSLLPKYGGPGMYGNHVHRAVLNAGEKESGCTIHFVDSGIDTGSIILQRKVPVLNGDTPDALAERIHDEEHIAIVEAAALVAGHLHNRMMELRRAKAEEEKFRPAGEWTEPAEEQSAGAERFMEAAREIEPEHSAGIMAAEKNKIVYRQIGAEEEK